MFSNGRVATIFAPPRRENAPAESDRVERLDEAAHRARPLHAGERDHRRGQHQSVERAAPGARDRQRDRRAHRMGEAEPGLRAGGLEHLADEGGKVALVEREIVDVSFARILELARRAALAAPVEDRHRKAAVEQVADRLVIFLDELGPAGEDRHRAARAVRRRPAGGAQQHAVGGAQRVDDGAGRGRVKRRGNQAHGLKLARARTPSYRAAPARGQRRTRRSKSRTVARLWRRSGVRRSSPTLRLLAALRPTLARHFWRRIARPATFAATVTPPLTTGTSLPILTAT